MRVSLKDLCNHSGVDLGFQPRAKVRIDRSELAVRFIAKIASDFLRDESGTTAIEYALIAGGISIVVITAVNSIGSSMNDRFVTVNERLK